MYDKINKNMLFLCGITLLVILITIITSFYAIYTAECRTELEINAQKAVSLMAESKNPEVIVRTLNESDSKYQYRIFNGSNYECSDSSGHLCVLLPVGNNMLLHTSASTFQLYSPLYTFMAFTLLIGFLVYLLSVRISAALTKGILKPFTDDIFSTEYEDTYAELRPFTRAIEFQSEEIRRQTENVQAKEVELQLITDNMNEGLVIIDSQGKILSVNNFALKLFEVQTSLVKQKHFTVLSENRAFTAAVEKALNSKRSNAVIELGESYYRIYCSPIQTNASADGAIILLFDITSTYQSEKLRREFSANVSHELKTPLTSINGYAQIISGGIAKQDDIPDFASKIAKESNRLMILIEDIMRLSNLDEGIPEIESSEISVKEIVTDIIDSLDKKASERNVSLSCSGNDFKVTVNKTQLSELIYNICDNAIKYNKENGTVTVTLSEKSVSVADTGIGIRSEHIDRIFERFYRVDKSHSKKVDGTGLGLSIVKHIAMQNNITIDVKSKIDEGSVFTLKFK